MARETNNSRIRVLDANNDLDQIVFADWFNKNKPDDLKEIIEYDSRAIMFYAPAWHEPYDADVIMVNGRMGIRTKIDDMRTDIDFMTPKQFIDEAYKTLSDRTKEYDTGDKNYRSASEENRKNTHIRIMLQDKDLLEYDLGMIDENELLKKQRMGNLSFEKETNDFAKVVHFFDEQYDVAQSNIDNYERSIRDDYEEHEAHRAEQQNEKAEWTDADCEQNLLRFSNPKFYEEAAGLTQKEILSKYGDTPLPIATIPLDDCVFKGIYNDVKDNHVYTGLGSFVDHWVHHHPEMETEDFQNMQEVFNSPSKRYFDKSKNAVVFEKEINGLKDIVFVKKAQDKLLYERSNYLVKKVPKRWIEISPVDGRPTISQSERSEAGIARNISARDDTQSETNIPQEHNSVNKKTQIKQETLQQKYDDLNAKVHEHCTVTIDGKTTELKQGLLNGYCDAREELDKWQNMTPKDLRKLASEMEKSNNKNIER